MIARHCGLVIRAGLAVVGVALAAPDADAQAAQGPTQTDAVSWLSSDSASKTVTLHLEATRPAGSPAALINGQSGAQIQIVVPLGWTVQWEWRSADSSASHSLVVMAEREKLPAEGGRPAFDNAMTRMVSAGLPAGQIDRTNFVADQAGWYWMLCGVPGHAIAGEYIGLRVDPKAEKGEVRKEK
jgi:Sulfocyanin (SoxE) domain